MLPRTQYCGVDREGFHNSEERLSPFLRPPVGAAAEDPPRAWQAAAEREGEFTAAQSVEEQDATRIAHAQELLGDDTLAEHKCVVPAGSVVICHIDLWHRASRKDESAAWRPMFAVRSVARVSDPAGPTAGLWVPDPQPQARPFDHVDAPPEHHAVWEHMFEYMGGPPPAIPDTLDPTQLERTIRSSGGEMTRLGAGYLLGGMVRKHAADSAGIGALRSLQRLLLDPAETFRRAAAYGLTAAGPAALPWLLSLLRSPVAVESLPLSPQANVDVKQGVLVQVVHAVAHCATDAGTPSELASEAVDVLALAMERAVAEAEVFTAEADPEALAAQAPLLHNMYHNEQPLAFFVIERRRTVLEGCVALGLIGAQAVADGESDTATAACAALLQVATSEEPGMSFSAFMTRMSVRHNAAYGLVRLTSEPVQAGAAVPSVHTGGGWAAEDRRDWHNKHILVGMMDEALRRGRQRLGSSLSESTRAALAAVVEQLGGPGEQESAAAEATPHYLIL